MVSVGKKPFTLHYPGSIADRLAICAGARVKENIEKGNMQSIESFAYSYLGSIIGLPVTCMGIIMNNNINNTQYFRAPVDATLEVSQILERVYKALAEKGYNPVNQIVGYIMSGDPTYITSHNNARSLIMRVERDELIEEALTYYINSKFINNNRK